jgi:hypothetical protein
LTLQLHASSPNQKVQFDLFVVSMKNDEEVDGEVQANNRDAEEPNLKAGV